MQHGPSFYAVAFRRAHGISYAILFIWLGLGRGAAADVEEARALFLKGQYAECIRVAEKAIADQEPSEDWRLYLAQAFFATGRYTNAYSVITTNLENFPWSVRLRLLGRDICRQNGKPDEGEALLKEVNNLGLYRMWAYQDVPNLVTMGQAALLLNYDPKRVLTQFFDRASKKDAAQREPYLASGELALDKGDFELAAKTFGNGLKKFPEDADLHFGLARAYAGSDRRQMITALELAFEYNTNHVPSFLLLADHLIDGEDYAAADKALAQALAVNPWHPEAWAYRAVLAHLRNDAGGELNARASGLKFWKGNPEVDHLIGRKLSQKYRFAEGASYQQRALEMDPKFLPARIQLAQDLLRLGREEEGWKLAEAVHQDDAYDVNAYNLATLQDNMAKFTTLTNRDFVLRMATNEAAVYGQAALGLLQRAKDKLCAKYGLELQQPTTVEIFPDPKDFGVRTFGMPGNPGYLGVCFGHVITANSPASQTGHPANWQAVLWHEFCHVVTLQLTKNKMPRWLSEGISVYEEKQENPTWGQDMNPRYREMMLGKDFTPLGQLSAAFLAPKSEMHLQFAYYESSLAAEFLISRFGLEALKKILADLGEGTEINAAITKHTAPLETLEKDFQTFARERAETLAPGLDFEKPGNETVAKIQEELPTGSLKNFHLLHRQAKKFLDEKKWQEATAPLEKLIDLYPGHTSPGNAYELLAQAQRGLTNTNAERATLSRLAARSADAVDAYARLTELGTLAQDWPVVAKNAERSLAVNPLLAAPYRALAQASEALGKNDEAIRAGRTLLLLDPPDPAGAHFQLARLLHQTGDTGAKRHLLQALEEAPRFRAAHKLLLEMTGAKTNTPPPTQRP